ncbi:MAG: XRE family transcriptional regulator [Xanthomonadales bacterium]|nr:XRE family transcriptional regulator [Xanthomonadales bacterium]
MNKPAQLGTALRGLRQSHGWKLRDVAARSGLSVSTLSKVERGQLSLTYDRLIQLAEGLEVDISTLFSGPHSSATSGAAGRRSVTRHGEPDIVETDNYRHFYPNTDLLRRPFVPIVAEMKARTLDEFGPLVRHSGEEFTYVLEGTVIVHTEHYAPTTLEVGDSIHIDSNMGHAYLAGCSGPCRVLSVCSATETAISDALANQNQQSPDQESSAAASARQSF